MTVTRQITKRCASCAQRRRRLVEADGPFTFTQQIIDRVIHWTAGGPGPLCGQ